MSIKYNELLKFLGHMYIEDIRDYPNTRGFEVFEIK